MLDRFYSDICPYRWCLLVLGTLDQLEWLDWCYTYIRDTWLVYILGDYVLEAIWRDTDNFHRRCVTPENRHVTISCYYTFFPLLHYEKFILAHAEILFTTSFPCLLISFCLFLLRNSLSYCGTLGMVTWRLVEPAGI